MLCFGQATDNGNIKYSTVSTVWRKHDPTLSKYTSNNNPRALPYELRNGKCKKSRSWPIVVEERGGGIWCRKLPARASTSLASGPNRRRTAHPRGARGFDAVFTEYLVGPQCRGVRKDQMPLLSWRLHGSQQSESVGQGHVAWQR
jgi:hypothetical protein